MQQPMCACKQKSREQVKKKTFVSLYNMEITSFATMGDNMTIHGQIKN